MRRYPCWASYESLTDIPPAEARRRADRARRAVHVTIGFHEKLNTARLLSQHSIISGRHVITFRNAEARQLMGSMARPSKPCWAKAARSPRRAAPECMA